MWYFPIYALGIICLSYNHKIAVFKNVLQPQLFKLFESNHGLRGSGSPVLTVTGFVNGRGQFSTPHRIHTPWPITKKFVASDYVGDLYGCAKFGANPSTGGFWANGWNITIFIYLFITFFFMNSPTGQTRRRISTIDGSNDADSRKDVPFGGFVNTAPHFGGEIPQKPQFLGRE